MTIHLGSIPLEKPLIGGHGDRSTTKTRKGEPKRLEWYPWCGLLGTDRDG